MNKTTVILATCLAFSAGLITAQQSGKDKKKPTQQSGQNQQQTQQQPDLGRPLFLSGKVLYDDGSPAGKLVQVELVCNGIIRRQVHTQGGHFSFDVGSKTAGGSVMDASVASPGMGFSVGTLLELSESRGRTNLSRQQGQLGDPNRLDLSGCELRATQPGFRSNTVDLSFRRPLDSPDVGVIMLHPTESVTGTTTSVTTLAAPGPAKKAYRKAVKHLIQRKPSHEKASIELEKATEIYPEFSSAWHLLGQVRLALQDEPGAREAFSSAIATDPKYLHPYMSMIELEVDRQRWDEVSWLTAQVTQLHPYHIQAHYYRGFANYYLNRFEVALESLQKVRASPRSDDYPYACYILGVLLAKEGHFDDATGELRHFLQIQPSAPEAESVKLQLAEWQEDGWISVARN